MDTRAQYSCDQPFFGFETLDLCLRVEFAVEWFPGFKCVCAGVCGREKIMKTGYLWTHTPLQDEHIVCERCQYAVP